MQVANQTWIQKTTTLKNSNIKNAVTDILASDYDSYKHAIKSSNKIRAEHFC